MTAAAVLPPIQLLNEAHGACAYTMRVGTTRAHADHPWPGFVAAAPIARAAALELEHVRERSTSSAWLADAERAFESTVGERTQAWRFPGLCELELADRHVLRWRSPPRDARVALEALVGAGLVFALAERDCWCVHAGAVARADGGVVALLGASGAGKSTLARQVGALRGFTRVSDDILPLALDDDSLLRAFPHFPQLKLDPAEWYPAAGGSGLPVRVLLVLERAPRDAPVELGALAPNDAFLRLVAHTAGARALRAERLDAHMRFCTALVGRVALLRVPQRDGDLDGLARDVAAVLEQLP